MAEWRKAQPDRGTAPRRFSSRLARLGGLAVATAVALIAWHAHKLLHQYWPPVGPEPAKGPTLHSFLFLVGDGAGGPLLAWGAIGWFLFAIVLGWAVTRYLSRKLPPATMRQPPARDISDDSSVDQTGVPDVWPAQPQPERRPNTSEPGAKTTRSPSQGHPEAPKRAVMPSPPPPTVDAMKSRIREAMEDAESQRDRKALDRIEPLLDELLDRYPTEKNWASHLHWDMQQLRARL
jgi:hypothetical protein